MASSRKQRTAGDAEGGSGTAAPLLKFSRGKASAEPECDRRFRLAYDELFRRVSRWLASRGADEDSARDLAQDVFLRAWERRADFPDEAALSGFVFACAKNLRIDRARRSRALTFVEFDADDDSAAGVETPHAGLDAHDLAYLRGRILDALDALPEDQRECFTLSRVAERAADEIAAALGISENLVYARTLLARKKLALALDDLRELAEAW
ncbi:MAG: RNA polymerase sigma factor [Candidatus Spyradosoma sp.]